MRRYYCIICKLDVFRSAVKKRIAAGEGSYSARAFTDGSDEVAIPFENSGRAEAQMARYFPKGTARILSMIQTVYRDPEVTSEIPIITDPVVSRPTIRMRR